MRGRSQKTLELTVFARMLLEAFHPMTLRQLHYAIFSAKKIAYENTPAEYKRLSRATTMARRKYRTLQLDGRTDRLGSKALIPPAWIVDELREPELVSMWDNAAEYMDAVKRSYRRNNWQDQPNYCEVWSEKAAVLGSLRPVTEEYGVTLRACRGYSSAGMESAVGRLFEEIEKPITVFYLGDHDPSGCDIERNAYERTIEAAGKPFNMAPLAIHAADIEAFNLPPQQIKATDSRAASFRMHFGTRAATVELDALPVDVLRQRVRDAIADLIDFELWERQIMVQDAELKCIAEFADTVKTLPQVPPSERSL
jgi:hypothetical protein